MAVAKVIVDLALDRAFDYEIPPGLAARVRVGTMVRVPFGRSTREGYVLKIAETSDYTGGGLKPLAGLCESRADVPEQLVRLGEWMSEYYCCTREQALRAPKPANSSRRSNCRSPKSALFWTPTRRRSELVHN